MSDDQEFDFDKIVPMPKPLGEVHAGAGDQGVVVYMLDKMTKSYDDLTKSEKELLKKCVKNMFDKDWVQTVVDRIKQSNPTEEQLDNLYEVGKTYVNNYLTYGHLDWYTWSIENWGTKWNACDVSAGADYDSVLRYEFNTAWSMPYEIYMALSREFPSIRIKVTFADEDMWGGNCGEICFVDGEEEHAVLPNAGLYSFLYSISLDQGWLYDNLDFYDPETLRDVSEHIEECGYFRDGDAKEIKKAIEEYLEKQE